MDQRASASTVDNPAPPDDASRPEDGLIQDGPIEDGPIEDGLIDAELLVEDVSIDGMCGVY